MRYLGTLLYEKACSRTTYKLFGTAGVSSPSRSFHLSVSVKQRNLWLQTFQHSSQRRPPLAPPQHSALRNQALDHGSSTLQAKLGYKRHSSGVSGVVVSVVRPEVVYALLSAVPGTKPLSSRTIAAPFAPIMCAGAFRFPVTMYGIIEVSMTRRLSIPPLTLEEHKNCLMVCVYHTCPRDLSCTHNGMIRYLLQLMSLFRRSKPATEMSKL